MTRGRDRGGNRGGGRRGGRGGNEDRETQVSKKLSWLLRHGAVSEGLKVGKGAYINLADVLANRKIRGLNTTLQEIKEIVETNEKQRFSLIHISELEDGESTSDAINDTDVKNYLIRANQGHSIAVDDSDLLVPITLERGNLPKITVHGTRAESWPKILQSGGLKPMTRNHVHFATGIPEELQKAFKLDQIIGVQPTEDAVKDQNVEELNSEEVVSKPLSGMRNTSTVLIFLDLRKALEAGLKFWISDNGVILSEGESGIIKTEYFQRVVGRGGEVLTNEGQPAVKA